MGTIWVLYGYPMGTVWFRLEFAALDGIATVPAPRGHWVPGALCAAITAGYPGLIVRVAGSYFWRRPVWRAMAVMMVATAC